MRKFEKLRDVFESLQADLDLALEFFAEQSGDLWLLDDGVLLDTGYLIGERRGGVDVPHAYRDQYGDDAPKEERLFVVYSLSGVDQIETANGGDFVVNEPEFVVRVYASKRWTRSSNDAFGSYISLLDFLPDTLYEYGWDVSDPSRVGDVDDIGFETYVFYVSGVQIKERG